MVLDYVMDFWLCVISGRVELGAVRCVMCLRSSSKVVKVVWSIAGGPGLEVVAQFDGD